VLGAIGANLLTLGHSVLDPLSSCRPLRHALDTRGASLTLDARGARLTFDGCKARSLLLLHARRSAALDVRGLPLSRSAIDRLGPLSTTAIMRGGGLAVMVITTWSGGGRR